MKPILRHLASLSLLLFAAGCFKHQGAPERPVTAHSLDEAVKLRDTVQAVELPGQELSKIPVEFASMPKLEQLQLRGAKGLTQFDGLAPLAGLKLLDLSETRLDAVPQPLFSLAKMETLYLAGNALKTLPKEIASLKALRYLNLDRNALASLPEEIGELDGLRWLRLNANQLTALPAGVAKLKKLQRIYLEKNKLEAVPEVLKDMPLLEDIALDNNTMIREVPQWLTSLPKLRQLNLDSTAITNLPPDLSGWRNLQVLSLTRCKLSDAEQDRVRAALPERVHIAF